MVKGAPLQVDVSGNFMFNDKFLELPIDGVLRLLQWLDFKFQTRCISDMDMI
jgi:hypothetical protein